VLWFAKFGSVIRVQDEFRREYCAGPPDDKSIQRWYEQNEQTRNVAQDILLRCLGILMMRFRVRQAFIRCPRK
jgi:hypothetical protein